MLTPRPPMGWNSWNTFGTEICEKVVLETAEVFVKSGLRDAGYEYIVIDDCWEAAERDENGKLAPNKEKFPHGIKYLADKIHGMGLKLGIYSSASVRTCKGLPASFDHEFEDAETFAEWGVDYLKYDYCYKPESINEKLLYRRMGLALRACGRDIVYAACNSLPDVGEWIKSTGANLYRTTGDIMDNPESVKSIAYSQLMKLGYSGVDCYNDIDMLVVGMYNRGNPAVAFGGCTDEEYKMHFALWCMMGTPLMIGCDVRQADKKTIELLSNEKLIRINQDELARPPFVVGDRVTDKLVLFRHLSDGKYAIGVFNYTDGDERPIKIEFFDIGLSAACGYSANLEDIFTGERFENVSEFLAVPMKCHSCRIFIAEINKK